MPTHRRLWPIQKLENRLLLAIDLAIEHDTIQPAEPGDEVIREIRVYNDGNEVADDVFVRSTLTNELDQATWRRTTTKGRVRPAPGVSQDKDIQLLGGNSSLNVTAYSDLMAVIGDFNGDGLDDFLFQRLLDQNRNRRVASVIFGGLTESVPHNVGFVRDDVGFNIPISGTGGSPLPSADPLGDLDGDGFDDFSIANMIVFGGAAPPNFVDDSRVVTFGEDASIYEIGDANADGFRDILLRPTRRSGAISPMICWGGRNAIESLRMGSNDECDHGASLPDWMSGSGRNDHLSAASSVGDLDGDGWGDFAVGSAKAVNVVFGGPGLDLDADDSLKADKVFQIPLTFGFGDSFGDLGGNIQSGGDFNGDGFDDLLLSFDGGDSNGTASERESNDRVGGAVTIYGGPQITPGREFSPQLDRHAVFRISTLYYGRQRPFATSGDFNKDGITDLKLTTDELSYVIHGGGVFESTDFGFVGPWYNGNFEHQWHDSLDGKNGYGIRGDVELHDINGDDVLDTLVQQPSGSFDVYFGGPELNRAGDISGVGDIVDVFSIAPGEVATYLARGFIKEGYRPIESTVWSSTEFVREAELTDNAVTSGKAGDFIVTTNEIKTLGSDATFNVRIENASRNNLPASVQIDSLLENATWNRIRRLFPETIALYELTGSIGGGFTGPGRVYTEIPNAPGYDNPVYTRLGFEVIVDRGNGGDADDIYALGTEVQSRRVRTVLFPGGDTFVEDRQVAPVFNVRRPQVDFVPFDINGDGVPDTILADPPAPDDRGAIYVLYGDSDAPSATASMPPKPSEGFAIGIDGMTDSLSYSFASGDVNGDGYDDIIFAEQPRLSSAASPIVRVVYGGPSRAVEFPQNVFRTSSINAQNGFEIQIDMPHKDFAGATLASGDINGDGFDDIVAAEAMYLEGGEAAPRVFVIYGGVNNISKPQSTSELNGWNGFTIVSGEGYTSAIRSLQVESQFDANGDGIDDILIGDPSDGPRVSSDAHHGAVYVIFGRSTVSVTGTGMVNQLVDVPHGSEVVYTVSGLLPPSASAERFIATAKVTTDTRSVDLYPINNVAYVALDPGDRSSDLDADGETNFHDFLVLANNYGKNDARLEDGDLDLSGEIDFLDFLVLAREFGGN